VAAVTAGGDQIAANATSTAPTAQNCRADAPGQAERVSRLLIGAVPFAIEERES
jgi:hypothetical protein